MYFVRNDSHEHLFATVPKCVTVIDCIQYTFAIMPHNFILQVELARKFMFRHAKKSFPEDAIPVIAANMDTVGTFDMAKVLAKVF